MVTGTSNSHQRVKPDQVSTIEAIIPTDSVLNAFTRIAKIIFEKVYLNRQQIKTLAILRDMLLPRLISGQLRLPQAKSIIEDAL